MSAEHESFESNLAAPDASVPDAARECEVRFETGVRGVFLLRPEDFDEDKVVKHNTIVFHRTREPVKI